MIVRAHVSGQGGALINADLLRVCWGHRPVGEDDEGIQRCGRADAVDRGRRIVGAPPVVGHRRRTVIVAQVTSAATTGGISRQAAETHTQSTYCACTAVTVGNASTVSRGLVAGDRQLAQGGGTSR